MKNKIIVSVSCVLLLVFVIIVASQALNSEREFIPPTDGIDVVHYELGQSLEEGKLSITIDGLEKIENRWFLKGLIDEADYEYINENYTFMFGKNDIIVSDSNSNVIDQKEVYMICNKSCDFNQIMLIDNRTGKVLAVINL